MGGQEGGVIGLQAGTGETGIQPQGQEAFVVDEEGIAEFAHHPASHHSFQGIQRKAQQIPLVQGVHCQGVRPGPVLATRLHLRGLNFLGLQAQSLVETPVQADFAAAVGAFQDIEPAFPIGQGTHTGHQLREAEFHGGIRETGAKVPAGLIAEPSHENAVCKETGSDLTQQEVSVPGKDVIGPISARPEGIGALPLQELPLLV